MDTHPSWAFAAAFLAAIHRADDRLHLAVLASMGEVDAHGMNYAGDHWRMRLAARLAAAEREFSQALGLPLEAIDIYMAKSHGGG